MKVKLLEIVKSQLLKIELSISVDESFTTAHQSANVAMVEALVRHVEQLDNSSTKLVKNATKWKRQQMIGVEQNEKKTFPRFNNQT